MKSRKRTKIGRGAAVYTAGAAAMAVCLVARPQLCADAGRRAIALCAGTLVPALFPFICLNAVLMAAGAPELAQRTLGGLFSRVFGAPPSLCAPYFIGLTAGFPVGARAAANEREKGRCTASELERSLALCSNAGPAFVIGGVGTMLGDLRIGVVIYAAQIVASAAVGVLAPGGERRAVRREIAPEPPDTRGLPVRAVAGACTPMLTVCAFVLFFAPVSAVLLEAAKLLSLPDRLCAALLCFCEMAGGISYAASTLPPRAAAVIAAGAVGWSGLCVAAQVSAAAGGPRMKKYFLCKAATALLCAAICALGCAIFGLG